MKVRRYKYILTEVVEEEHLPRQRSQTMLPVPARPLKPGSPQYSLARLPPAPPTLAPLQPAPQSGRRSTLVPKSLLLVILGVLSILMMTVLTCAVVGLLTLPAPEQQVKVMRRPVMIGRNLPTLTPTPAAAVARGVVASPPPAAGDAVLPSDTPAAVPPPPPTPAGANTVPPPAAVSQHNNRPTLISRVTLNVRSGPGLEHGLVGQLAVGQATGITGQNPDGSWWQIEYPLGSGLQAWVSADPQYTTVSQTVPQAIAQASTPAGPPVAAAVAATSALPGGAPATPTPLPSPTGTPLPASTPTETPIPLPEGWVFSSVRFTSAESLNKEGLLFFGELINNTGTAQNLSHINTTYYDPDGQKILYGATIVYVPLRIIPQGGRVPFELIAEDLKNVADFDLEAIAQPEAEPPRQDFEFVDITSAPAGPRYCINGRLRNPGPPLANYLKMAAVLYDSRDQVINFGYAQPATPVELSGDQTVEVNLCVDPHNQEVARYELRAWGL